MSYLQLVGWMLFYIAFGFFWGWSVGYRSGHKDGYKRGKEVGRSARFMRTWNPEWTESTSRTGSVE